MSRLTTGQKTERCLKLILGLRLPEVAQVLEPHGLDPEVLDQGWALMRAITLPWREQPPEEPRGPSVLARLAEFQSTWFPIAEIALHYRFPAVASALFNCVSQARGQEVVLSVGQFLSRLQDMEAGAPPYGDDGPAAREVLRARGLTDETVAAGLRLIRELKTVPPSRKGRREAARKEREAVDAMWAWYREWGRVARTRIKNRNHLRALGFTPRAVQRGGADGAVDDGAMELS